MIASVQYGLERTAGKLLAVVEVLGLLVEAARTVVSASAHEQADSAAGSVSDIAESESSVVHDVFSLVRNS